MILVLAQSKSSGAGVLLLLLLLGVYLFPSFVAIARRHHNGGSIAIVNIFLGWTFIGWVVALAMAFSAVRPATEYDDWE